MPAFQKRAAWETAETLLAVFEYETFVCSCRRENTEVNFRRNYASNIYRI